jgi:hypothetical protein
MGAGNAVDLSVKDQSVSLVLMGRDLIERTDQTNAGFHADNYASEMDLIHAFFETINFCIVPRQVGWRHEGHFL